MELSLVLVIVVLTATVSVAVAVAFSRRHQPLLMPSSADPEGVFRAAIDEVLRRVNQDILNERGRTSEQLDQKKELIDASLVEMRKQLDAVKTSIQETEVSRSRSFGELNQQLLAQSEGVNALTATAGQLRDVLGNVKARGQWGERMAEDVIRLAGFIEGKNYIKQAASENGDGSRGIPDFTFMMPPSNKLHMDVKFPFENYTRYRETQTEADQVRYREAFLKDVRNHLNQLGKRRYADSEDSINFVLMFIPNESIFAFVNEYDDSLIDDGIKANILICSPLTLYAILALVHQATANFTLERKSKEILELIGQFEKQWSKYSDKLEKLQKSFNTVHSDYSDLMTTRSAGLQRPLSRIAAIRGGDSAELLDLADDRLEIES